MGMSLVVLVVLMARKHDLPDAMPPVRSSQSSLARVNQGRIGGRLAVETRAFRNFAG